MVGHRKGFDGSFDLKRPMKVGAERHREEVHAGSIPAGQGPMRAVVADKFVKAGEKTHALATTCERERDATSHREAWGPGVVSAL
jgi:hypothetical protein